MGSVLPSLRGPGFPAISLAPVLAIGLLLGAGLTACSITPLPRTAASSDLMAYEGQMAQLFDDSFEPAALGLDVRTGGETQQAAVFQRRAEAADAVMRVRVTTVSSRPGGTEPGYNVTVSLGDLLGGKRPLEDTLTLSISPQSASYGLVRSNEGTLAGKTFIAFLKAFRAPPRPADTATTVPVGGSGGAAVLNVPVLYERHAHFAADTREVATRVDKALILERLK